MKHVQNPETQSPIENALILGNPGSSNDEFLKISAL
jgi:hypothetical protein